MDPEPHSWPAPASLDELDAGGFQDGADRGGAAGRRGPRCGAAWGVGRRKIAAGGDPAATFRKKDFLLHAGLAIGSLLVTQKAQ